MDSTANNANQPAPTERDIPRLIHDDDRLREALRKAAEVAERRRTATQAARKSDRWKS